MLGSGVLWQMWCSSDYEVKMWWQKQPSGTEGWGETRHDKGRLKREREGVVVWGRCWVHVCFKGMWSHGDPIYEYFACMEVLAACLILPRWGIIYTYMSPLLVWRCWLHVCLTFIKHGSTRYIRVVVWRCGLHELPWEVWDHMCSCMVASQLATNSGQHLPSKCPRTDAICG